MRRAATELRPRLIRDSSPARASAVLSVYYTVSLRHPRQHKEVALVFVSTFEPIALTPNAGTQRNEVPMLYDTASSSNLPSLYPCLARNVLGRVPHTPLG